MLQISFSEFRRAMIERFGFIGPTSVLHDVFGSLDTDGDGVISCDEIFAFITGRKNKLSKGMSTELRERRAALLSLRTPHVEHSDDVWSEAELQAELKAVLKEQRLTPQDLMQVLQGPCVTNRVTELVRLDALPCD